MPHLPEARERKNIKVVEKSTYRDLAARNPNYTESACLEILEILEHPD